MKVVKIIKDNLSKFEKTIILKMRKTLQKPERWQDFEDLCKKLFGEIWQIPYTIKKNGRQGQPQCGVDVYGIPKGEKGYFGIQCKGKDEYTHAQLTEKEINQEIKKAKKFKPDLNVFIFATTANKSSKIEEYIRLKDLKSRDIGNFEILLYCWEDIVDLINEQRDVFNWYHNGQQYREIYKMSVIFENGTHDLILNPPFIKQITKYIIKRDNFKLPNIYNSISLQYMRNQRNIFGEPTQKNNSWCSLNIYMKNTGTKVIDDWKLLLKIEAEKYQNLDDDSDKSIFAGLHQTNRGRNYWVHKEEGYFLYKSNESLIQKDAKNFKIFILPKHDADTIKLEWQLLARDYNDSGELNLIIKPEYKTEKKYIEVEDSTQIKPEEIIILDEIVYL